MIRMEIVITIIGTKIVFCKSSSYYNAYKSSCKNEAKRS